MEIAVGNTATSGVGSGTSLTYAHNVSATSNLLIVGVDTVGSTTDLVTGVTYNGVSMTRASSISDGVVRRAYLYFLVNPTTGSNNVVVSTSGSTAMTGASADYSGCNSSQPDSTASSSPGAASTTHSLSFTTVADNSWTVALVTTEAGGSAPNASTGSTLRVDTADAGVHLLDSGGAVTPAGSYTMNFTSPTSTRWSAAGMSFAPSGGASATFTPQLLSLSVG